MDAIHAGAPGTTDAPQGPDLAGAAGRPRALSEMPGFQMAPPEPVPTAQGTRVPAAAQLACVVSYDGAGFAGFARQPGLETVQGTLEQAFGTALHRPVQLVCAGRTDAGGMRAARWSASPCPRPNVPSAACSACAAR